MGPARAAGLRAEWASRPASVASPPEQSVPVGGTCGPLAAGCAVKRGDGLTGCFRGPCGLCAGPRGVWTGAKRWRWVCLGWGDDFLSLRCCPDSTMGTQPV